MNANERIVQFNLENSQLISMILHQSVLGHFNDQLEVIKKAVRKHFRKMFEHESF